MTALAPLYLDTARLGRMNPGAQLAVRDFARLYGEVALPLYCPNFFRNGISQGSYNYCDRYAGLDGWRGTIGLRDDLRRLVGAGESVNCILASRSKRLMQCATEVASLVCKRVLVTDLCWTPYSAIAERCWRRSSTSYRYLPLREAILTNELSADDVEELIVSQFAWHDCDGILLPAVSHDGIRLRVDSTITRLKQLRPDLLAVVDASQAIGHVPDQLGIASGDIVIAGTHKWMAAGMPLGVMFVSNRLTSLMERVPIRDPLYQFISSLEEGTNTVRGETVNVWPLIACHGALRGFLKPAAIHRSFECQRRNRQLLDDVLTASPAFKPIRPHEECRSGIDLLRFQLASCGEQHGDLRRRLQETGIVVSAYPNATIRVSLPQRPFEASSLTMLRNAFCRLKNGTRHVAVKRSTMNAVNHAESGEA